MKYSMPGVLSYLWTPRINLYEGLFSIKLRIIPENDCRKRRKREKTLTCDTRSYGTAHVEHFLVPVVGLAKSIRVLGRAEARVITRNSVA